MKYDSDNQRIHRIGSVIKKEIAQIVQNDINDPRIKDVVITEVGGTVGDIEGQPFYEAIRQLVLDKGRRNTLIIHTTLLPYINAAAEIKTVSSFFRFASFIPMYAVLPVIPSTLICKFIAEIILDFSISFSFFMA